MKKSTEKKITPEEILKDWLLSLLPEEDNDISTKNIQQYLPDQQYFLQGRTIRLSNYSYKWVNKLLKKMHKAGINIELLTYVDFNNIYRRYLA